MTYYVIHEDGRRFGPATEEHLRDWLREGRIGPATTIEDEEGIRRPLAETPGFEGAKSPTPDRFSAPPEAQPAKASRPVWIIPVVLVLAGGFCVVLVLAAILFPVFSQARFSAKRAAGMANAKLLGLSALMYAGDNDDRLPPRLASATEAMPYLGPYTQSPTITKTYNPAGSEFLGNRKLEKRVTSEAELSQEIALFYESKIWADRKRVVTWLDGHASATATFDPILDLKGIKGK